MKRRKNLLIATLAGASLAAFAAGQFWGFNQGPIILDRTYGVEVTVQQLVNHARLVEQEVLLHRSELREIKEELKALQEFEKDQKDKLAKLEKRVRNMELRGK
jgi:hypothetical protein